VGHIYFNFIDYIIKEYFILAFVAKHKIVFLKKTGELKVIIIITSRTRPRVAVAQSG
jgi:hypothetical protein